MPSILPSANFSHLQEAQDLRQSWTGKPTAVAQSSKCFEESMPRVWQEHTGEEFNMAWNKGKKVQENYSQ